jgi:diguanylate cyclase (GGDEF)-like protein
MSSIGRDRDRDRDRHRERGGARGGRRRGGPVFLRVAALALVTAGAVFLVGGGSAFWLCLPCVLLACGASRTRTGAALGAGTVLAAAALPSVAWMRLHPLPSPLLAVLVPAVSAGVLVGLRERLARERDAMRDFALSDPLTGIANRRSLLWRAQYEIARHTRARRPFAVVMLDLDGFKLLNDRFGHGAGDDLLRGVAAALERSMRAQDTVARIGGDEFCVLAPETEARGTQRLASRITHAVAGVTAGIETVHASMGIAVFPDDGISVAALLHAADQQLLAAKRGRGRGVGRRRAA